jgi:hypothetical protein
MATSRFVFCGKSRDTWLRYFPGSLEPVWWVGRWGEPEFGQAGRKRVAEDHAKTGCGARR